MNRGQEARLTSLRRIQVFLDDNAAELGPINKSTSRADLDAAVTGLAKFTAQQAEAEKEMTGRTKEKVAAREELRLEHMQPIAAIARKKLGKTPAIQDLRLPAKNTSDESGLMFKIRTTYYRLVGKLTDIQVYEHFTGFG